MNGSSFDVVRILSLGTIGLGFLLAFLSFRLLGKEQSIQQPRQLMLTAINRYMMFSISLCVLGLASEVYREFEERGKSPVPTENGFFQMDFHDQTPALEVAEKFLKKVDASNYKEAYEMLDSITKHLVPYDNFEQQCRMTQNAYGLSTNRTFISALRAIGPVPDGTTKMFYMINFQSAYEKKSSASEAVTMTKTDSGTFEVANFIVR